MVKHNDHIHFSLEKIYHQQNNVLYIFQRLKQVLVRVSSQTTEMFHMEISPLASSLNGVTLHFYPYNHEMVEG